MHRKLRLRTDTSGMLRRVLAPLRPCSLSNVSKNTAVAGACKEIVLPSAGGKQSAVELFDEGRLLMFQNDTSVPDWAQVGPLAPLWPSQQPEQKNFLLF